MESTVLAMEFGNADGAASAVIGKRPAPDTAATAAQLYLFVS
jgi:hypothetical protein